jgi:hypothetical protein
VAVLAATTLLAQANKRRPVPKPAEPVETQQSGPKPEPTVDPVDPGPAIPAKKNGRPAADSTGKNPTSVSDTKTESRSAYTYEFSRPEFFISYVLIKHDEFGKGTISFKKKGVAETQTDPITLSPVTLGKINDAVAALNFLDSAEDYQYEKDYSHLGNVTFTLAKDGKSRTTRYNWTLNKDAKTIADEYRRIGNQYVWQFDMAIARENQPLEAPLLMDTLDSYFKRNEISDPKQMVPLLKELSNDERIPLIARNHATKLVTFIEKMKS